MGDACGTNTHHLKGSPLATAGRGSILHVIVVERPIRPRAIKNGTVGHYADTQPLQRLAPMTRAGAVYKFLAPRGPEIYTPPPLDRPRCINSWPLGGQTFIHRHRSTDLTYTEWRVHSGVGQGSRSLDLKGFGGATTGQAKIPKPAGMPTTIFWSEMRHKE